MRYVLLAHVAFFTAADQIHVDPHGRLPRVCEHMGVGHPPSSFFGASFPTGNRDALFPLYLHIVRDA